jgi:O-methyltransferase involved in polyketide biosynthesis
MEQALDVQELMYNDPDRADVTEWLNDHGWTASGVTSQTEMQRLDRWVLTEQTDEDAFSTFVVGERG